MIVATTTWGDVLSSVFVLALFLVFLFFITHVSSRRNRRFMDRNERFMDRQEELLERIAVALEKHARSEN